MIFWARIYNAHKAGKPFSIERLGIEDALKVLRKTSVRKAVHGEDVPTIHQPIMAEQAPA